MVCPVRKQYTYHSFAHSPQYVLVQYWIGWFIERMLPDRLVGFPIIKGYAIGLVD